MSILWTTVRINDMDGTLAFYERTLGLVPAARYQASPSVEIAMLGDGETKLELLCDSTRTAAKVQEVSIGFTINKKIEDKKKELESLGYHPTEIKSPYPGLGYVYVEDPNGIRVQFVGLLSNGR